MTPERIPTPEEAKRIVEGLGGCWHWWGRGKSVQLTSNKYTCSGCGLETLVHVSNEPPPNPTFDNAVDLMWILERLYKWEWYREFLLCILSKSDRTVIKGGGVIQTYLVGAGMVMDLLKTPTALPIALIEFLEEGDKG